MSSLRFASRSLSLLLAFVSAQNSFLVLALALATLKSFNCTYMLFIIYVERHTDAGPAGAHTGCQRRGENRKRIVGRASSLTPSLGDDCRGCQRAFGHRCARAARDAKLKTISGMDCDVRHTSRAKSVTVARKCPKLFVG